MPKTADLTEICIEISKGDVRGFSAAINPGNDPARKHIPAKTLNGLMIKAIILFEKIYLSQTENPKHLTGHVNEDSFKIKISPTLEGNFTDLEKEYIKGVIKDYKKARQELAFYDWMSQIPS
jgi:hypothetical protein